MRADDWLEELVQLYEYRVEDLAAGRSPRGSRDSFQSLRETLLFSSALDGQTRRRLMQTERKFRDLKRQGRVRFAAPGERSASPLTPGVQETLQRLSDRLWEADLRRWMFARLWAIRTEPRLLLLRLLATATENLNRQWHRQALRPLLTLEEALEAGLTRLPQLERLTEQLLAATSTAAERQRLKRVLLDLEHQASGAQDRRAAAVLQGDNLAGGATGGDSRPSHAASAQPLLTALTWQTVPTWQEEQQLLFQGLDAVRSLLGRWPASNPVRGGAELLAPDSHEAEPTTLAVNLDELGEQPRTVRWQQVDLTLCRSGTETELCLCAAGECAAGEQERRLPLRDDLPAELRLWSFDLSGQLIHAALEDNLLLLRCEAAAPRALQVLANRARLCSYLTQPYQAYAPMRLARAAALLLRGRSLEGADLSAASAARYAAAAPPQLGQLAARGLDALLALSSTLSEQERCETLQQAAEALGLSRAEGQLLSELLGTAGLPDVIFDLGVMEQAGLPTTRTFGLLDWPAAADTLEVDGRRVQLFELPAPESGGLAPEEAVLAAQLEELPPQPVDDLLTWPLERNSLVLVQHSHCLARTTIPYGTR